MSRYAPPLSRVTAHAGELGPMMDSPATLGDVLALIFGIPFGILLIWIGLSGLYCWGQDNGHWGNGPGVE